MAQKYKQWLSARITTCAATNEWHRELAGADQMELGHMRERGHSLSRTQELTGKCHVRGHLPSGAATTRRCTPPPHAGALHLLQLLLQRRNLSPVQLGGLLDTGAQLLAEAGCLGGSFF